MRIEVTAIDEHPGSAMYPQGYYDASLRFEGTSLSIGPSGVRVNGKVVLVPADPYTHESAYHKFETPDGDMAATRLRIEVTGD